MFTIGRDGELQKVRTAALQAGTRVASPGNIPDPPNVRALIGSLSIASESAAGRSAKRLDRLIDGGLMWDRVREVRDTGVFESIYDLEVRPGGRKIENFLAGTGGVFVSNTAGYVDPGWDGYLTLELSNVANLPITIYPGMKIGQISFFRLTTPAETPYGSKSARSKYQGQRGPTASRFFEEFRGH